MNLNVVVVVVVVGGGGGGVLCAVIFAVASSDVSLGRLMTENLLSETGVCKPDGSKEVW